MTKGTVILLLAALRVAAASYDACGAYHPAPAMLTDCWGGGAYYDFEYGVVGSAPFRGFARRSVYGRRRKARLRLVPDVDPPPPRRWPRLLVFPAAVALLWLSADDEDFLDGS